jgi:hypothetical protein
MERLVNLKQSFSGRYLLTANGHLETVTTVRFTASNFAIWSSSVGHDPSFENSHS